MPALQAFAAQGSSPLTRGKLSDAHRPRRIHGLIPAHAGKTMSRLHLGSMDMGSSPLTRGKLGDHGLDRAPDGLIPAHAGKTTPSPNRARSHRAHPRSRGENGEAGAVIGADLGSSPLTRGKPPPRDRGRGLGGLIPAHAGKTYAIAGFSPVMRAHPRSRGENRIGWGPLRGREGSSPLTRGKRGLSRRPA